MNIRELIEHMHEEENLTVGEIASALKLNPRYVYEVLYKNH